MNRLILLACLVSTVGFAETIEEKKAGMVRKEHTSDKEIGLVNQLIANLRVQLENCYREVAVLNENKAPEEEFKRLLAQVNQIKQEMMRQEKLWRESAIADAKKEEEGFALWDQEETTLAQLVMEYGAMDYLYVIPPEMSSLKLNMHSSIPIPRESWSDVLEIILSHNGIGVKRLGSYTRQLFIFKQDPAAVQAIASKPEDLQWAPSNSRVFYVLSPPVEHVKSVFQFMERFSDAKQTFVYQVGSKIAVVSSKEEVEKLLSLYNTVWESNKGKVSRVVTVSKMGVKEMEKILTSFFGEAMDKARPPFAKVDGDGLSLFPLPHGNAIVLIGPLHVVDRAEQIVKNTEEQLQDPTEMTVYLYTCRHSDPTDLAKVLEKVYASLLSMPGENQESADYVYNSTGPVKTPPDGYPQVPPLVVTPPQINQGTHAALEIDEGVDHFIPDPKTGTLLMVVRRDALVKIKELLRRLDVPKRMVQIEVLLFEKQFNDDTSFGLNLLKIGSKHNHVEFNSSFLGVRDKEKTLHGSGIFQFIFGAKHSKHFPAFDLAYNFLMTQEDVQLNAAPSVTTVNQTPATIKIVEELSINNGAVPVVGTNGINVPEKSYSRAQYGITIVVTPTVHPPAEDEESGFVTLQTNITFDTPRSKHDDRPHVDRRNVENEVRVADGETVILGGLRKKITHDNQEKVPFLGELPVIGKLFGTSKLTDHNTEMFIFITPTIITDPKEDLERLRTETLKQRPGDIPEFLDCLVEARKNDQACFFRQSMKMFWNYKQ